MGTSLAWHELLTGIGRRLILTRQAFHPLILECASVFVFVCDDLPVSNRTC